MILRRKQMKLRNCVTACGEKEKSLQNECVKAERRESLGETERFVRGKWGFR